MQTQSKHAYSPEKKNNQKEEERKKKQNKKLQTTKNHTEIDEQKHPICTTVSSRKSNEISVPSCH